MEDLGLGAGLAGLAFWAFVAAVAVACIWNGIRKREAQHETIRRLIESGQPVDQELIDKVLELSDGEDTRHDRAFKITAMWVLPTAVGMAIFGLILGSQDPDRLVPMLGVSALLAVLGIGFLVASKFAARWYPVDSDSKPNQPKG